MNGATSLKFGVILLIALALHPQRAYSAPCYTLTNGTASKQTVLFQYDFPFIAGNGPTMQDITLDPGASSQSLCYSNGAYARVLITGVMFKESKTALLTIGDVPNAAPAGTLTIVPSATPTPLPPGAPGGWQAWASGHQSKLLHERDRHDNDAANHAGDCHLINQYAILLDNGSGKWHAQLWTEKTVTGDVWHMNLHLLRADGSVVKELGHFDSPTSAQTQPQFAVNWDFDFSFDPATLSDVAAIDPYLFAC